MPIRHLPHRGIRLFAPGLVILLAALVFPAGASAVERLAVLVYHHLEDPATSDVSCTPKQFAAHLEGLLKAGFTLVNLTESKAFLQGLRPQLKKPVLITFDDGYESLYHHALPVAERLRVPMMIFVVTGRIGRQPQFARYLNRQQIKEMADSGWFEFGSHSHDLHTDVMRIHRAFSSTPHPVESLMTQDLRTSSALLAELLGTAPMAIAWPYGKFNDALSQIARQQGFRLHFTSIAGYNEPGSNPFAIKRLPVTSRDTTANVVRKAGGQ